MTNEIEHETVYIKITQMFDPHTHKKKDRLDD